MRIIYCDLCRVKIGEVSREGVESREERLALKIGKWSFPEVCTTCYARMLEFTKDMKRHKDL